jgi:hypothetical protein
MLVIVRYDAALGNGALHRGVLWCRQERAPREEARVQLVQGSIRSRGRFGRIATTDSRRVSPLSSAQCCSIGERSKREAKCK